MSPLVPLAAGAYGAVAGLGVDRWVGVAAAREERAGRMPTGDDLRHPGRLDRHLTGGGARRALVPALAAAGCLLVGLRYGLSATAVPFLFFVPVILGLGVVDLHTRRLPNAVVLPSYGIGLVLVSVRGDPAVLLRSLGAGSLLLAVFAVLAIRPTGMGLGDVKVAGLIGLFVGSLGVGAAVVAAVLASLAAFVVGGTLVVTGIVPRRTPTPFGPYLALGAVTAVLAGPALFAAYLGVIG